MFNQKGKYINQTYFLSYSQPISYVIPFFLQLNDPYISVWKKMSNYADLLFRYPLTCLAARETSTIPTEKNCNCFHVSNVHPTEIYQLVKLSKKITLQQATRVLIEFSTYLNVRYLYNTRFWKLYFLLATYSRFSYFVSTFHQTNFKLRIFETLLKLEF
mgnify:CR=1 FL=1